MTREFVCLKDWNIDSGTYFKKGRVYKGKVYNNGKSVKMYGERGVVVNFHVGSEYFNI